MRRRNFLSGFGCVAALVIAGCIDNASDDDSTDEESTLNDEDSGGATGTSNESEVGETFYQLQIEAPEESPGEFDHCEFEALPEGAQTEFEKALTKAEFETEDRVVYRLDDSPEFLDTDCYAQYVKFQGKYYKVNVNAAGG